MDRSNKRDRRRVKATIPLSQAQVEYTIDQMTGNSVRVTYDQDVMLRALPDMYALQEGSAAIGPPTLGAVDAGNPRRITYTFPDTWPDGVATAFYVRSKQDPGVRGLHGGYVSTEPRMLSF